MEDLGECGGLEVSVEELRWLWMAWGGCGEPEMVMGDLGWVWRT